MIAARTSERGGRLIDKESLRVDGEEEARGLLLMNKEAFSLEAVSAAASADTLRFLTCGSVDDGKSTLIGRLLYDSHLLMEDQVDELERDSCKHGTDGENIDFALLVDGLEAEREQGITIDVAYRFFATPRRRFIVADTPGPRPVYPQHGDRRLHRRSRHPAGRRHQGAADADAPACRDRARCSASATSCWR